MTLHWTRWSMALRRRCTLRCHVQNARPCCHLFGQCFPLYMEATLRRGAQVGSTAGLFAAVVFLMAVPLAGLKRHGQGPFHTALKPHGQGLFHAALKPHGQGLFHAAVKPHGQGLFHTALKQQEIDHGLRHAP